MMVNSFEKGLDEMAKIPDLEPKILADLYKSMKNELYIKTPVKPREKPNIPDPNERPMKFPDENKWVWDLIEDVREKITASLTPLHEYIKTFDKFKDVLKMNPDDFVRNIEMEENPWEIE
jgi:dynein heavy chain, axonemal